MTQGDRARGSRDDERRSAGAIAPSANRHAAPSNGHGVADAPFDLDYEIETDIPPREFWEHDRDSVFYFDTASRLILETVLADAHGRLLEVGSGSGHQILAFAKAGGYEIVGLDMSQGLLRAAHYGFGLEDVRAGLTRGAAEQLPFRDGVFSTVLCQGSLDHFAAPEAFLAEAARILEAGGRLIIALQNFDSASCRISRALYRLRGALRLSRANPTASERPYWRIPENHTFKGNVPVLRRLGERHLRLERMFGVSMFWLLPSWRRLLRRVSPRLADKLLRAADRAARRTPRLADMLISVWRKA